MSKGPVSVRFGVIPNGANLLAGLVLALTLTLAMGGIATAHDGNDCSDQPLIDARTQSINDWAASNIESAQHHTFTDDRLAAFAGCDLDAYNEAVDHLSDHANEVVH